jgi:hypothetical protein
MPRVYLLGAGFSNAISEKIPLMNKLSELVQAELDGRSIPGQGTPVTSNFERWLSYLAERPPWLPPADQVLNRAGFLDVSNAVYSVLSRCQMDAVGEQDHCPDWLQSLVKFWEQQRATVITFNYDLLIELAWRIHAAPLRKSKPGVPRAWSDLYSVPLSSIGTRVGWGPYDLPRSDGMRLLKLHGSLNWYYSGPDGPPGDTIYTTRGTEERPSWNAAEFSREAVERAAYGLEPMIVPPAAVKSPYYSNHMLQGLWREAGQALRLADELVIIGFGLPPTDLLVSSMLATTLSKKSKITPVDYGAHIVDRIKETFQIEYDDPRLERSFVDRRNSAIPDWVDGNVRK